MLDLSSALLERSSHCIALAETNNHQITWINKAGMDLFEMTSSDVEKGIRMEELFQNEPIELVSFCRNVKKNSGDSFIGIFRFKTTLKNLFWGTFKCEQFLFNRHSYNLITIIDLKDMSMAHAERDRENERFKVLFQFSTVGMLVVDSRGSIVTLNPFAEKQFGYSQGELVGKKIEALIPDHLTKKHEGLREHFTHSPQNRPMGIGLDLYGKKKDGSTFPVEISLSHYRMSEQVYVIAFINDITIRKQAEETIIRQKEAAEKYSAEVKRLNEALERRVDERTMVLRETLNQLEQSKEELEEALEKEKELSDLKSRFVAMASHEFRTPLSTILSSASLIERYQQNDEHEKREKHIHRIKENVKNLNDILEDFLSLGKLEEGLIKPRLEKLNVSEFISVIIHDINEVKKDNQVVNYQHSGDEMFTSDKHLLKNILINLLSNAVKFSNEDGVIDASSYATENMMILKVKDHGIGISEDDRQHLFDRFFRGKNALNIKGTGLGLHIVSKYLELLNGIIQCESHLNEGTEFTIILQTINE